MSTESWDMIKETVHDYRRTLWATYGGAHPAEQSGDTSNMSGAPGEAGKKQTAIDLTDGADNQIESYLLGAYRRLLSHDRIVTAGELISLAKRAGYDERTAVAGMFRLVNQGVVYADAELQPNAVIADSQEQAVQMKTALLRAKLDDLIP